MVMLIVFFALFLISVVALLCFLNRVGEFPLTGDEKEYITPPRKMQNRLWVRVPVQGWIVRASLVLQFTTNPWHAARVMAVLSGLGIILATWISFEIAGFTASIVTYTVLLLSVERAILSLRLWPDVTMGTLILAFVWALIPGGMDNIVMAAFIAALALGIRVEGVVLCAITVFAAAAELTSGAAASVTYFIVPCAIIAGAAAIYVY